MSSLPRVPPSSVDYSKLLPLGVKGVSKARKFQPNNGSTFTSTNPVIRIPLNSTGFLDTQHSYLSFKCTFTKSDGNNSAIDGGGQGVIRQLRLEGSDGSELERIDNYNVIWNVMSQCQVGADHSVTLMNAMEAVPTTIGNNASVQNANGTSRGYSVKLMSALLNNPKMVPLGWVAGGGLVLELTLDSDQNAIWNDAGTQGTYSISEVNYIGQVVEMEEGFNQSFRAMLASSGGIQWAGSTFRGHNYSFTSAANGSAVIPVSERAKSIKALYTILRLNGGANDQFAATKYTLSHRTFNDTISYQVKIGSNVYPSQPITGSSTDVSQYVAELVKSFSALGDVRQGSALTLDNFKENNPNNFGSAVFALDLETYPQSTDILESGINSSDLALPINVLMSFGASANTENMQVNTYALVDSIFTLDSMGMLTVSI